MTAWQGWLAPGSTWQASGAFEGPVWVGGTWRGHLRSGDWVEVAPGGAVEGVVEAPQVLIGGRVAGSVVARERATLLPTAEVVGEVHTAWLDVRPGARWTGRATVTR